jgi:Zn-dependent protease with chaperone function
MLTPVLVLAAGLMLAWCGAAVRWASAGRMGRGTARQVVVFLFAAVAFTHVAFAMLAAPLVVGLLPAVELPPVCRRALQELGKGGPVVGWFAVALLAVSVSLVLRQVRTVRRQRRDLRVEPEVGTHQIGAQFDLVTLPSALPVAYSLGGRRRQVVVSDGFRARLDDEGLAAVVAHEAAHLRARHDRWLAVAALLDAALWFVPWARTAVATLQLSVECWADAEAAGAVGRPALRTALLATVGAAPVPPHLAAMSRAGGALVHRLRLLAVDGAPAAGDPPRVRLGRPLLAMLATGAMGVGVAGTLVLLHHVCLT